MDDAWNHYVRFAFIPGMKPPEIKLVRTDNKPPDCEWLLRRHDVKLIAASIKRLLWENSDG